MQDINNLDQNLTKMEYLPETNAEKRSKFPVTRKKNPLKTDATMDCPESNPTIRVKTRPQSMRCAFPLNRKDPEETPLKKPSLPMPLSSTPPEVSSKTFDIFMGNPSAPPMSLMRFRDDVDPSSWNKCRMGKDMKPMKGFEQQDLSGPTTGAGSTYGAKGRLQQKAASVKQKYEVRKPVKRADLPWQMMVTSEDNTTKYFEGSKQGGMSDNADYYLLTVKATDPTCYEAYPVQGIFDFKSVSKSVNFTAEEAEAQYQRREKIHNYFALQTQMRLKGAQGVTEDLASIKTQLSPAAWNSNRRRSSGDFYDSNKSSGHEDEVSEMDTSESSEVSKSGDSESDEGEKIVKNGRETKEDSRNSSSEPGTDADEDDSKDNADSQ